MIRTLTRSLPILAISFLLSVGPSWAASSCLNVGVVTKSTIDKKEKNSVAGDIKSLKIEYDYEMGQISGTITWNKVPTSKIRTKITIGEASEDARCNHGWENYLMTGWTKKFKLDPDTLLTLDDRTWVGKIQVVSSGKNFLNFIWTQPSFDAGNAMTQLCVAAISDRLGTFYDNSTTCFGQNGFINCQGPGWIPSEDEIDFVQNFAFQKVREFDSRICRYPLGQIPDS